MRRFTLLLVLGFLPLAGCASEKRAPSTFALPGEPVAVGGKQERKPEPPKADAERPALPRKIIYTADLRLIVADLAATEDEIRKLVATHNGFISKSEITGRTGTPRDGFWTVRVPVARFDDFVAEVRRLGVPEKSHTDSRDVTEEFYDLQARLKNKKVEEERLLKHLEKSTGKLEDILAVEREISRVRGEIEQMEGKLKVLNDLTDLTTVTIRCQEIKDYVPPQAPGFGQTISDTFHGSVNALTNVGKALVLVVVALTPWLPLIAVIVVALWLVVRRVLRAVVVPNVQPVAETPPQT